MLVRAPHGQSTVNWIGSRNAKWLLLLRALFYVFDDVANGL